MYKIVLLPCFHILNARLVLEQFGLPVVSCQCDPGRSSVIEKKNRKDGRRQSDIDSDSCSSDSLLLCCKVRKVETIKRTYFPSDTHPFISLIQLYK